MKNKQNVRYCPHIMGHVWMNDKGQMHREDGPAVIRESGYKYWYKNGKQHRTDGPAVEYPKNSSDVWCLNGYHMNFETYCSKLLDDGWATAEEIVLLRLTYG